MSEHTDRSRPVDDLFESLYVTLRRIAREQMKRKRCITFQPTALVHEAYLRMARNPELRGIADDPIHVMPRLMRQILVDWARARMTNKRGGAWARVPLSEVEASPDGNSRDPSRILSVHEALEKLEAIDARGARIFELRYFAQLEMKDIARVLGVSVPTVERRWREVKAIVKTFIDTP